VKQSVSLLSRFWPGLAARFSEVSKFTSDRLDANGAVLCNLFSGNGAGIMLDDAFANWARYGLAVIVAITFLLAGIWDAYCYFLHREELTVTAIFRSWFAADPMLIVLATILFVHLVVQR